MPLGRAMRVLSVALLALAGAACAGGPEPAPQIAADVNGTARMPREIRVGATGMVIQAVEQDVSRQEVAAAIGPMIANAPICMNWPALWIEQARRTSLVVRYDLMARDWGASAVASAHARMDEFVELGLMSAASGADPNIVSYTLTDTGERYLDGAIDAGRRPDFCGPAERRLVEITTLEWGQFPCGTVRVSFTHDGEAWPSWVRSDATRARLAAAGWPTPETAVNGSVSLSRQWFRRQDLPQGALNGGLRSACYDARRQQITGDDLLLSLPRLD